MHLTYAKTLAIVLTENMNLETIPLKNETLTCKHKISDKILANCSPYFTTLQYINYLETKRSYFFSFEVLSDSEKESRKKIWGQGNTR